MARIVAGIAGGRNIAVPPAGTRPTTDRVREALFSRLEHVGVIDGARVLDLYAGSGALGLESASRGARRVDLVESDRRAAQVCRDNARKLGLGQVAVHLATVEAYLERQRPAGDEGDVELAFLDPPYDLADERLARVLTLLLPHLADGAVVVVERSRRSPVPAWPAGAEPWKVRTYGETSIHAADVARAAAPASPAQA